MERLAGRHVPPGIVREKDERIYRVGDGRRSRLDSVAVELWNGTIIVDQPDREQAIYLLPHEARHVRNRLNALLSTIARSEGGER
jgi:hypothetical protein